MSQWKRVICIIVLAAMLPVGLLLTGLALPEYYGESYYAELSDLYRRLRATEGKKIIVVGGSNVAFGVDSRQMEETLAQCGYDYTVCNFGLYAAVGTSAMLELSRGCLGEGDIVILAIEPTSETFSTYFGATAFWKCAESDPSLLLGVNREQQAALFGDYLGYLQTRLEIRQSGILPTAEGVYAKSSFNDRGDMIYNRQGNTMPLGYDSGNPIDLASVTFQPEFVEQVEDYCAYAESRGARVFMSFSPMNRSALTDGSDQAVYDYFLRCQQTFSSPIISNPEDYILDSGWFYDSNYHLNSAGAQVRTCRLTEDLLNELGYYQELAFELPAMPAAIAQVENSGDESGWFTFTPAENGGYLVSGLTESGQGETSLSIPSVYDGQPVVGLTETAFAGNPVLTELILPETIESLPDGAFSGCVNLTRLVLTHTQKLLSIGERPFEGAENLKIYVPVQAYAMYRDGAGCASNPWEVYLGRIETY